MGTMPLILKTSAMDSNPLAAPMDTIVCNTPFALGPFPFSGQRANLHSCFLLSQYVPCHCFASSLPRLIFTGTSLDDLLYPRALCHKLKHGVIQNLGGIPGPITPPSPYWFKRAGGDTSGPLCRGTLLDTETQPITTGAAPHTLNNPSP